MSTVRDIIAVLVVVTIVGLATATVVLNKRLDEALEQKENATSLVKGYEDYTSGLQKFDTKKGEVNVEVQEDLSRHREWADQPVPDDLADKLRKH